MPEIPTWAYVLVAVIAASPGILAASVGLRNKGKIEHTQSQIATGNGDTIGSKVEQTFELVKQLGHRVDAQRGDINDVRNSVRVVERKVESVSTGQTVLANSVLEHLQNHIQDGERHSNRRTDRSSKKARGEV